MGVKGRGSRSALPIPMRIWAAGRGLLAPGATPTVLSRDTLAVADFVLLREFASVGSST
jgi:hypothetical protein